MLFRRLSLMAFVAALSAAAASAADPTPRLSALEALGRQNMESLLSDPRTGGPQGISIGELPAADAHRQAEQVDSFWAVRAGSKAPIRQIELAHPSHVPGVAGSRPFVSDGPISQTPGFNPRITPRSLGEYRLMTQTPPAAAAPVAQPVTPAPVTAAPATVVPAAAALRSTMPTSTVATAPSTGSTPAAPPAAARPIFSSSFQQWGDVSTVGNSL